MMIKTPLALSLAGLLALTACGDPGTRIQDPNYRAQNGALGGAALGAILGAAAQSDGSDAARTRSALLGATLGAGIGGAIGSNLDRQAQELRDSLGNPDMTVTNMGSHLVVNLPQDVLFATGSADLRSETQGQIRSIAANLVSYPASTVRVIGHTDSTGSLALNQDLSNRRAYTVASILAGAGVPSNRLSSEGHGPNEPVASNDTTSGRAANRRVEILIIPTGS
jgi:outer membrane protein OmpA-like peptidoglycan-associated protein